MHHWRGRYAQVSAVNLIDEHPQKQEANNSPPPTLKRHLTRLRRCPRHTRHGKGKDWISQIERGLKIPKQSRPRNSGFRPEGPDRATLANRCAQQDRERSE